MGKSLEERFWGKVDKGDEDECWEWTATTTSSGYGNIKAEGGNETAHRISFRLENSEIPSELWVLHHCDNKKCVNPDHLYAGDRADNFRDAVDRDRMPSGEDHPQNKLTDKEIEAIRDAYKPGETTQGEVAEKFGISRQRVSEITEKVEERSVLTEDDVREIREKYEQGEATYTELAEEYPVKYPQICQIVNRNAWTHVD